MRKIHVVHIGGRKGIGAASSICKRFGEHIRLSIAEAFLNDDESFVHDEIAAKVAEYHPVKMCLSDKDEDRIFYVAQQEMASSLYQIAETAKSYAFLSKGTTQKWVDHATTKKTIPVHCVSLDQMSESEGFPTIVSMDIQGSEYDVMRGGSKSLTQSNVAIISEFETIPLYSGQGLLEDQMRLLRSYGYFFVNIVKSGKWHFNETLGNGILMWGEALWLRDINFIKSNYFSNKEQMANLMLDLSVVAFGFNITSYAYHVVNTMLELFPEDIKKFCKFPPFKMVFESYSSASILGKNPKR